MDSFKKAFTIAEVLITLIIIGVVAAVVIPAEIRFFSKKDVESNITVAYKTVEALVGAAESEKGSMLTWKGFDVDGATKNFNKIPETYFFPYIKGNICDVTEISHYGYDKGVKYPDGKIAIEASKKMPISKLKNGMVFMFEPLKYKTQYDGLDTPAIGTNIIVDINGKKGANAYGKDIFVFSIYFDGTKTIQAYGGKSIKLSQNSKEEMQNYFQSKKYSWVETEADKLKANCYDASTSNQCAALLKQNGWEFPKGYPWL